MTGPATGGQDALAEWPCGGLDFPGRRAPAAPRNQGPPEKLLEEARTFGVPGAGRPPWSPPAALICEANLGPRRQVLNCLYESHAGLPMTTLR